MLIIEEPGAQDRRQKKKLLLVALGVVCAIFLFIGIGMIIADGVTGGEVLGWFSKNQEEDEYDEVIAKILAEANGGSDDTTPQADPDAPDLDEVVKTIGNTYTGNIYADSDAPIVFANYVYGKAYDGDITFETAYSYFEDLIAKIDDSSKMDYYYQYAQTYYKLDRNLKGTIAIFERADPGTNADTFQLSQYYACLRSLYQNANDETKASYYEDLIADLYDNEDEEPIRYYESFNE